MRNDRRPVYGVAGWLRVARIGSLLGIGDEVEHASEPSHSPARATRTQAKSARMGALYGRWQRSRQRHPSVLPKECHKVCGRWSGSNRSKSPTACPRAAAARCDLATHCKNKEACVVGDQWLRELPPGVYVTGKPRQKRLQPSPLINFLRPRGQTWSRGIMRRLAILSLLFAGCLPFCPGRSCRPSWPPPRLI